jgi:hypothetical protein
VVVSGVFGTRVAAVVVVGVSDWLALLLPAFWQAISNSRNAVLRFFMLRAFMSEGKNYAN